MSNVIFEQKGFRDVVWCPYLNEPAFIEYVTLDDGERGPHCQNCESYKPETHQFICHILKPSDMKVV